MASTTASHYSQHALASLRRRSYHSHQVPGPTPSLNLSLRARPGSMGSIASLVPTTPQFSMIDFLRSQVSESPAQRKPRPLSVVDALANSPGFGYAPLPMSPDHDHPLLPSPSPQWTTTPIRNSTSPSTKRNSTQSTAPGTPSKPSTSKKAPPPPARSASCNATPSAKKNRDSAIVSFFRSVAPEEVEPTLRPLLLAPAARPASPNPNRNRIREDPEIVIAATESRTVPIGGRRAAHIRAKRSQWDESFARGRPSLSIDIDSEMSYPSERVDTPVDYVYVGERPWHAKE